MPARQIHVGTLVGMSISRGQKKYRRLYDNLEDELSTKHEAPGARASIVEEPKSQCHQLLEQ